MASIKKQSKHCIIANSVQFGENVSIGHNCVIEENIEIGSNTYIDSNTTICNGVTIEKDFLFGANCIIGEYWMNFCLDRKLHDHPLTIGKRALIRSGLIVYEGPGLVITFKLAISLR